MNKIRALIVLAILSAPFGVSADAVAYSLQVDGLACPFCAYGIEKNLSTIKGVEDIKVDVAKGHVIMTMEEGTTLPEPLAREQIRKAGFTLRSISELIEHE